MLGRSSQIKAAATGLQTSATDIDLSAPYTCRHRLCGATRGVYEERGSRGPLLPISD